MGRMRFRPKDGGSRSLSSVNVGPWRLFVSNKNIFAEFIKSGVSQLATPGLFSRSHPGSGFYFVAAKTTCSVDKGFSATRPICYWRRFGVGAFLNQLLDKEGHVGDFPVDFLSSSIGELNDFFP